MGWILTEFAAEVFAVGVVCFLIGMAAGIVFSQPPLLLGAMNAAAATGALIAQKGVQVIARYLENRVKRRG